MTEQTETSEKAPPSPVENKPDDSEPTAKIETSAILLMMLLFCDFMLVALSPPGPNSDSMTKFFAAMTAGIAAFWFVGSANLPTKWGTYTGGFALFICVLGSFTSHDIEEGCNISVYAEPSQWQCSGVFVRPDQQIVVTPDKLSQWHVTKSTKKTRSLQCSADGTQKIPSKNAIVPSARIGALIARIGEQDSRPFEVGLNEGRAPIGGPLKGGYLYLMCNDDYYGDNSGSISVSLQKSWKTPILIEGFNRISGLLR